MHKVAKKLHYSVSGSGPNLVLLHGFLETNAMWEPLNLEEKFTCIKIELPGHGKSQVENKEQCITFIADCVDLILKTMALDTFDMIGHSFGGYVALAYAAKFGLPGQLILLHSNFWEDDAQKKIDRQRVANIVQKNKNLFLNEALPALFIEPKQHFVVINNLILEAKKMTVQSISESSIAMQKRRNHADTMAKFSSEITVIQGEKDRLVPLAKMIEQLKGLNNQLIVLPNVGHMGQHENSRAVYKAILNTLDKSTNEKK